MKPLAFPLPSFSAPGETVSTPLTAVDSHTCGQETRVIVAGLPELSGSSLREMRDDLARRHDWLRRVAVMEPRGHASMFAAALVPARDESCVCGVIFMDAAGYHDMCGHATIGVATTLLELGFLTASDGEVEFALETPAGPILVRAQVEDGRATSVAFRNQPAFFHQRIAIDTPDGGTTEVAVAYGGQWYAFLDASVFGLRVDPSLIDQLVAGARSVRAAIARASLEPEPLTGAPPKVGNIVWCDEPSGPEAAARNVPVNKAGGFDRSPCGTATCARLAIGHTEGSLGVGETFVNQGLLGTLYRGRILEEATVGPKPAVVPEIEGSAWLTGRLELWIDEADPLSEGFLVP